MAQNLNKFCPSCSISQEPYMIWLSFMVHLCKPIISPAAFLFWQIASGVKGQKIAQNDKKFPLSHSVSQESYMIWLSFLVHMYKMMISSAVLFFFSFFQNFDFLGF